jgi:hypothetical protein
MRKKINYRTGIYHSLIVNDTTQNYQTIRRNENSDKNEISLTNVHYTCVRNETATRNKYLRNKRFPAFSFTVMT